jgi:dimethylamine monooxygenase subunit A
VPAVPSTVVVSADRYTPFDDAPFRHAIGLKPLDPAAWLELDGDGDRLVAEKQRLLAERHADVVMHLPQALEASAEAHRLVVDHLVTHASHRYGSSAATVLARGDALHPIDAAGRLVPEDLVVMLPGPDGYVLGAASLCFPTRWRLADKIGRPMSAIHTPVPLYEQIASGTDTVMAKLKADRPVWRLNWSLLDDDGLYQPGGHSQDQPHAHVTPENAGEVVQLRVERQCLRRLPETGAALFSIRVHQHPVGTWADEPEVLARLAAAIGHLPPEIAVYKSIPTLGAALLTWITTRLQP